MPNLPTYPSSTTACTGCDHIMPDAGEGAAPEGSINRRTAIHSSVLTAVATLLGTAALEACATGKPRTNTATASNGPPLGKWMIQVRPADFPELAKQGGYARVDGDSDNPVALVRTASGYTGFSLVCPHAGGTLNFVDGGFLCPNHGAKFSADGTWVGGHPAKAMTTLTVIEKDGVLTLVA